MRNLKKFLALVLAMVMAFSLMLTASAANFDDKHFSDTEEVTQAFKEAVAVLTGLDVIKGDGDGEIKNIRPQSEITRAEAAALVYRIATGDIDDKQVGLYADYSDFVDVKPHTANDDGDWFAGYVGYCQNAGIIKGKSATVFDPYGKVTGYEVLAMILRAVGYGKNGEFEGSNWQVNVASLAKTKHISDSVTSAAYNYTLNMNARREIVAELLFRGSLIPQVKWAPGLGYTEYENAALANTYKGSLAWEVFRLSRWSGDHAGAGWGNDKWGRPQLVWKASLNPTSSPARTVATLKPQPKQSFHDLQRECDVADLMEFGTAASKDYILYVNNGGSNRVTDTYHIVAADTVTKVGGYGRQVEIYTQEYMDEQFPWHNENNYWSTDKGERAPDDTIVMIDTVVAKVITVNSAVLDGAGHVITPARMTVDLYDADVNQPTRRTISKPATSKDNWEYDTGDVLSLNGYTEAYKNDVSEESAYETTTVINNAAGNLILVEGTHVENIQKMTGVQGKQTVVYRNLNQHQVDGKDYFDDLTLKMDKALQNTNTTYTWYYDQYGYVQAIDDGGKANYGVITAVYAAFVQGESQTTGRAKAIATVKYADGTTGTEEIDYFLGSASDVDTYAKVVGTKMDESVSASNVVQLWPQYDLSGLQPMEESEFQNSVTFSPVRGVDQGIISMAPVAASNQYTYLNVAYNKSGILYDNLWKFVKTANDMTVAVEVAGGGADYKVASTNTGDFAGHWNANTAAAGGKLYKNLAYITKDVGGTNSDVVAWLDDDTQIIVRNPANNSIVTYDGVSALPGDVTIAGADTAAEQYVNEIDWADTDNDGRADVVYLTGTVNGLTTYGLFYFGGTSKWDGTTGTMEGWLNGESYSLVTGSLANYNVITSAAYDGHLFAVQLFNGALQNIMEVQNQKAGGQTVNALYDLSASANTSGTILKIDADGNPTTGMSGAPDAVDNVRLSGTGWSADPANLFHIGSAHGNPYSAKTEAVYYLDSTSASSTTDVVTFNPNGTTLLGSTVQVWRDLDSDGTSVGDETTEVTIYHLTPNSKVYGIGTGVTSGFEALEYLNRTRDNKVTIVYENEGTTSTADHQRSILEIYVVTDNDNTPTITEGALNYKVDPVSLSGDNYVTNVTRRIGNLTTASTTAVDFDWQLYVCSSDGSSPVAVAGFSGTNVALTAGTASINVAASAGLSRGSFYFVRVSGVTDMSSSYTVDSEIFYVP